MYSLLLRFVLYSRDMLSLINQTVTINNGNLTAATVQSLSNHPQMQWLLNVDDVRSPHTVTIGCVIRCGTHVWLCGHSCTFST